VKSSAPAVMLLAGAAGLAVSGYLTVLHFQGTAPVCANTGMMDCRAVTSSAYSVLGETGIPVAVLGALWFLVSGTLAAVAWRRQGPGGHTWFRLSQLAWAAAGLLSVLYFVWAELVMLHRICEWCTAVHLLVLLTFLLAVRRMQQPAPSRSGRD